MVRLPASVRDEGGDEINLWIRAVPFLSAQKPTQKVSAAVLHHGNTCRETEWVFGDQPETKPAGWRRIAIPLACLASAQVMGDSELLRVRLQFPDAISPSDLGLSTDHRRLAMAISELRILPPDQAPQ